MVFVLKVHLLQVSLNMQQHTYHTSLREFPILFYLPGFWLEARTHSEGPESGQLDRRVIGSPLSLNKC